jgi:hypothetical protein
MKNKALFKKSFAYDWPLYVVLPLVAGFSLSYLLNVVHQPKAYEKLNVFVASTKIESGAFCKDIEEKFHDNGLKEVTAVQSNPNDALFAQKLNVVGYEGSDLFLLPESVLKSITPSDIMVPFNAELEKNYVTENAPVYYVSEGDSYGVRIKEKSVSHWLSSYIEFLDEDYYLCLNIKSKNIASYGLYSSESYDLALKAFVYLQGGAA